MLHLKAHEVKHLVVRLRYLRDPIKVPNLVA